MFPLLNAVYEVLYPFPLEITVRQENEIKTFESPYLRNYKSYRDEV